MGADPERVRAAPEPAADVADPAPEHPVQPVSTAPLTAATVIAMSRTAGNHAVMGYLGRAGGGRVLARAPGPLSAAQERAAIAAARAQLAPNGVRVVQEIVGTVADGSFGPITAQGVATFQGANALAQDGLINRATLDALVTSAVAGGMQDEAIFLVADWENLDIRTDTLTVRFDSTLAAGTDSALARQGGNLRAITIGASAFATSTRLGTAIRAQLTVANPAAAPAAAAPATLSAR